MLNFTSVRTNFTKRSNLKFRHSKKILIFIVQVFTQHFNSIENEDTQEIKITCSPKFFDFILFVSSEIFYKEKFVESFLFRFFALMKNFLFSLLSRSSETLRDLQALDRMFFRRL